MRLALLRQPIRNLCAILVEGVLHGDKTKVTKLLETNPALLLTKASAIDLSQRSFSGTAFQAALCTGDVEITGYT